MTVSKREKTLRLVITFPTTTAAMSMERLCAQGKMPGRIIPVPKAISAGCGMAWCAPAESRDALEKLTCGHSVPVEGWYYVML